MSRIMYWIDDSIGDMLPVVEGLFPNLWDIEDERRNEIRTKIIIWGNAYQEVPGKKGWTKEDELELIKRIKYLFLELCQNNDGASWENETYEKKKSLIEDCAVILGREDGEEEMCKLTKELETFWCSEENMKKWMKDVSSRNAQDHANMDYEESVMQTTAGQLTEKLLEKMELEEGADAAIDVRLLLHDYERVKNELPVISMELFHCLKQKGYKCRMYSTYGFEASYNQKWQQIYKDIYQEDAPVIFSRVNLSIEALDLSISDKFINAKG